MFYQQIDFQIPFCYRYFSLLWHAFFNRKHNTISPMCEHGSKSFFEAFRPSENDTYDRLKQLSLRSEVQQE